MPNGNEGAMVWADFAGILKGKESDQSQQQAGQDSLSRCHFW